MVDLDLPDLLRGTAILSVVGLCLVVAGVAVVAVVAEAYQTWTWYFRMEQAISAGTPIALGFTGLAIVSSFGLVYAADD